MEQRLPMPAPSLAMSVIDIFASPSDAFQSIKESKPSSSLWLIPMLCAYIIFVCHTILLFTDDALKTELMFFIKKFKKGS